MLALMALAAARTDASAGVADARLAALLEEHWEAAMQASPVWATQLGDHRYDDRLDDPSPKARAAWDRKRRGWLRQARALPKLGPADALTRDLFVEELATAAATEVCDFPSWSFSARDNPFANVSQLSESHPVRSAQDAANLEARYRAYAGYFGVHQENLLAGRKRGLVANAESVRRVVAMLDDELARPIEKWGVMAAGEQFGPVVEQYLRPAFTAYRDFLRDEILPHARDEAHNGLGALPNGAACYAAVARQHTTLPTAPAVLHQTGLDALAGIHTEMRALMGEQDIRAIFARLRGDAALHFSSSAEVEAAANAALARAKAAMPRFFGRLPQADCVVEPIPAHEAPYTTIAYYFQAVPGEKPGVYFVNTHAPETRPRFEAEVLAFHEAIPGHHLQIAISQELPDVPNFRRHGGTTVFLEGWALYTERLADEMGMYTGDLDRMGMLGFDAWRASRLVVDTGIHAMGWTREQAVQFMLANTSLAENNIRNEVDRYIAWPGQALAYKTGQLEVWRLRREAEAKLGEKFSLPAFHDVVLGAGPVTLPVLEARVKAWVDGGG